MRPLGSVLLKHETKKSLEREEERDEKDRWEERNSCFEEGWRERAIHNKTSEAMPNTLRARLQALKGTGRWRDGWRTEWESRGREREVKEWHQTFTESLALLKCVRDLYFEILFCNVRFALCFLLILLYLKLQYFSVCFRVGKSHDLPDSTSG